jgi:hypothetical protein
VAVGEWQGKPPIYLPPLTEGLPFYDDQQGELRVGDQLIKNIRPKTNQQAVLSAFQEEGWPIRIDDPIPPKGDMEPKKRLEGTIRFLNKNHAKGGEGIIRFHGDGTSEGVKWKFVVGGAEAARPKTQAE